MKEFYVVCAKCNWENYRDAYCEVPIGQQSCDECGAPLMGLPLSTKEEKKMDPLTEAMREVLSRFAFHKPDAEGVEKMAAIRKQVRMLAMEIQRLCPESLEKATALTQLSFVMMSANSAIVQQYPLDPSEPFL